MGAADAKQGVKRFDTSRRRSAYGYGLSQTAKGIPDNLSEKSVGRPERDEIDAQIWEIDENLIRAELTPAQVADHMARRKVLWGQKTGGTTCPTLGGEQEIGFARDVADRTGQSKRDVNRAVSRGEKIAPDVLKLVQGAKPAQ